MFIYLDEKFRSLKVLPNIAKFSKKSYWWTYRCKFNSMHLKAYHARIFADLSLQMVKCDAQDIDCGRKSTPWSVASEPPVSKIMRKSFNPWDGLKCARVMSNTLKGNKKWMQFYNVFQNEWGNSSTILTQNPSHNPQFWSKRVFGLKPSYIVWKEWNLNRNAAPTKPDLYLYCRRGSKGNFGCAMSLKLIYREGELSHPGLPLNE